MSKNIADYLHLYLGAEFYNLHYCKTEEDIKYQMSKPPKRLGYSDFTTSYAGSIVSRSFEHLNKFKLILRPLSSMTEEEAMKVFAWRHGLENHDPTVQAEEFRKMLELHFDLFNLHEQGLCLYKSDLV